MVCFHEYIRKAATANSTDRDHSAIDDIREIASTILEELESYDGLNSHLVKRATGVDINTRIQSLFERLEFYRDLYYDTYLKGADDASEETIGILEYPTIKCMRDLDCDFRENAQWMGYTDGYDNMVTRYVDECSYMDDVDSL